MAKKNISIQTDQLLSTIQKWLDSGWKKIFQFYIKNLQPLITDITIKQKKKSIKKNLSTQSFNNPHFFMWLGIAAIIAGILIFINPQRFIGWQVILVPLIAIVVPVIVDFFKTSSQEAKETLESYTGRNLIGKSFKLKAPLVNGQAELTIQSNKWILKGDNYPAGTRVRIIAVSKQTLFITEVA